MKTITQIISPPKEVQVLEIGPYPGPALKSVNIVTKHNYGTVDIDNRC